MVEYSIASFYDLLLFPFVKSIRHKVLEIAQEYNFKSILDVCCGTGNQLKLLKKHEFNVSGVDLSDKMLAISNIGRYKPNCIREDATDMSFNNESFDMAMITFGLHEKNRETAESIIHEMKRVTFKNGYIIIIDFNIDKNTSKISKSVIRLIEWIAGYDHYRHFRKYISLGGLEVLLKGMDFKEVEKYFFASKGIILKLLKNI